MEFGHNLEQELSQQLSPLQIWEQSPFQELQGGVVLQNMKVGSSDLESKYVDMRTHLLYFNTLVIGLTARNKSGKGGLAMGFWRLFHQDLYYQSQLPERGIDHVEWNIIPFAHCDKAAKLPKDLYPELGLVDPEKTPATNSSEDERVISCLQWALTKETIPEVEDDRELTEALKRQRKAVVWIIEASTPFVLPVTFMPPVEIEGEHDLGLSTLYNLALDRRTRSHMFLFAINPDRKLKDDADSNEFRVESFAKNWDSAKLFGGSTRVVSEFEGKETDVKDLPFEEQEKNKRLLHISMASAEAIPIQHARKDALNMRLHEEGIIEEPTDKGFYTALNARLRLPYGHFVAPENDWLGGDKDYDMAYLQNSYVLRKYPEILEAA